MTSPACCTCACVRALMKVPHLDKKQGRVQHSAVLTSSDDAQASHHSLSLAFSTAFPMSLLAAPSPPHGVPQAPPSFKPSRDVVLGPLFQGVWEFDFHAFAGLALEIEGVLRQVRPPSISSGATCSPRAQRRADACHLCSHSHSHALLPLSRHHP